MKLKDRLEGAIYGMLFASVIGQIPPLTAMPDEIIGVPTGAVIGAVLGGERIKRMVKL